ncbi:MAG: hypothetical protein KBC33_02175 [Candidatus Pacebacteria bacterium]|nr:hypothetical protein [Candidatus Paceibacterota bacterium]
MNKKIALFAIVSGLLPVVASAATSKTLSSVIDLIISYANKVLVLMMGIAVVAFVYHVIKYFILADSERKEAAPYVMWSLVGFFVILSMWGLVNILQNTFGLQNDTNRPAGWQSFTNIFPGGGSSPTGGANFSGSSSNQPSRTYSGSSSNQPATSDYNPAWNDPNSGDGEQ